jgi:hypothetical protein
METPLEKGAPIGFSIIFKQLAISLAIIASLFSILPHLTKPPK